MISVLCPSRDRPDLLTRAVLSLFDTAEGPVEVIVAADADDGPTQAAVAQLAIGYDVACVVLPERLGYPGLHHYYQAAANVASDQTDWLMVWNDDDQMLTYGWDTVIEALPPEVLIADPINTHSPLCCVPAIRIWAVWSLKRFSSDNPHVDTFWQDVGRATGTIRSVPVQVRLESPIKPHLQHGYYDWPHQQELAAAAAMIREAFPEFAR